MKPISCAEALVTNYRSRLRNVQEHRISNFHGGGDLKSHKKKKNTYDKLQTS